MAKKTVLVVPKGDVWQVKTAGAKKSYKNVSTQKEAIQIANKVAKNQDSSTSIHGRTGKIRAK